MAEDISIGGDASQAISEMRKLQSVVISSMEAMGASTRKVEAINRQLERTYGSVAAAAVQASQKTAAAMKSETTATEKAVASAEQLEAARRRASAATGMRENANGRVIDSSTGRFASAEGAAAYQRQLEFNIRSVSELETLEARLARIRMGQDAQAAASSRRREAEARRETEAYKLRERELAKSFGAADPTRWQRLSSAMASVPPGSWVSNVREASTAMLDMSNSTRYALYEVSNTAAIAGAALIAFGVASATAAVSHERAFANVERTTQTSAAGYEVLRRQLELMAMELPITYEGITEIAAAAGQLGINASGVASFTRVVAQLTATTNLTSDAAGVALARFRTFFSEAADPRLAVTEATFSNLASSILKVGVNSIATESGIVNVAVQIASMGDYAGLTANQVIGLAGALSSIGVAPELSRGTITRTFSLIGNAVSENGVQLEKFAKLAGVSSDQFRAAWGTDEFINVFERMMQGINNFAGDANLALMELGFNSVRDRPLLLRLAGAADEAGRSGGLLAQTLSDAYEGWTRNSELALQYSKISTTTAARLQVLGQAFEQLAASMGEDAGNALGELALQLTNIVKGFEAFSRTDAGKLIGNIALGAAIAAGGLLLVVAGAARTAASIQAIGTAWTAMASKSETATARLAGAMRVLNLSLGIVGILATTAAIVGSFIAMEDAAQKARRGLQDVGGLVAAMRQDGESAKAGGFGLTYFSENAQEASTQAVGMTEALYGIDMAAQSSADGMDALGASTNRVRYVFGDAAKEFYRAQLLQSEAFQNLFKEDMGGAFSRTVDLGTLRDMKLDVKGIRWDELMAESVREGGDVKGLVSKQLSEQLKGMKFDDPLDLKQAEVALGVYGARVASTLQEIAPEIRSAIAAEAALSSQSTKTFGEIYDGATSATGAISEMDEATQKTVDSIAQGFGKFVDTSGLIKLTQELAGIANAEDQEQAAIAFEQSWSDAYGGAAFSLEQYLQVFSRAGQEQQGFINDLNSLRGRVDQLGISEAFINDLAQMGPEASRLVQALVAGTDAELVAFENLWGQTGYDSMVLFATQAAIGQEIVKQVMAQGGLEALNQFNSMLSSGIGTDEALRQLQIKIDGQPLDPKTKPPVFQNATEEEKRRWAQYNTLTTTAYVKVQSIRGYDITGTDPLGRYADGGYVRGPGTGTSDSINAKLSNGEFVMTAAATRAIGPANLYRMMNDAQRGRPAAKGKAGGYATGGLVSQGGNSGIIDALGPVALQQFSQLLDLRVTVGSEQIARATNHENARDTRNGNY